MLVLNLKLMYLGGCKMKINTIIFLILVPMLTFCTPEPQKPTGKKPTPVAVDNSDDDSSLEPTDTISGGDPTSNIGNGSNGDTSQDSSFLDSNSIESLWDGMANKDTTGSLTIVGR